MSDDEDMVQVTYRVPRTARDEAQNKTEHGEMSELVRQLHTRVAFGEDVDKREQLKKKLERIRDDKDALRAKKREIDNEIQTLESEEARLEERLNETQSDKNRLEGALEMLEDELYTGTHIYDTYPRVKTAANTAGISTTEVVEMLKERNPAIPEYAFQQRMHAKEKWDGVPGYDPEGGSDE